MKCVTLAKLEYWSQFYSQMHQKYQEINAQYPFIDDSIEGNKCSMAIQQRRT